MTDDTLRSLLQSSPSDYPSQSAQSARSVLFKAAVTAIGAAVVIGPAFGYLVGTRTEASCTPTEQWCELGAVIAGGFAGFVLSILIYAAVGVAMIVHLRPEGQRAGVIATLLLGPVALAAIVAVLLYVPGFW